MDRVDFTLDLVLRGTTRKERIRDCRDMALEAERLAANASAERKDTYLDLAKRWRELASDMERTATARKVDGA